MSGPCLWPVSYLGCHNTDSLDSLQDHEKSQVEAMAAQYLWNWTGGAFSTCPVEYRPCRARCVDGPGTSFQSWGGSPWTPYLYNGQWYNVTCGTCHADQCGCEQVPSLDLGGAVDEVSQVLIDGTALQPTAYRLDRHRYLLRLDGQSWPVCQDMAAPITAPGTWQVEFTRGTPVPEGGQIAAGVLAAEMAKALCNDASCQLPQRIQTITRQGITVTMVDDFTGLSEKGRTGLWLVDSWVASVMQPPRGSTVVSPDYRQRNLGHALHGIAPTVTQG